MGAVARPSPTRPDSIVVDSCPNLMPCKISSKAHESHAEHVAAHQADTKAGETGLLCKHTLQAKVQRQVTGHSTALTSHVNVHRNTTKGQPTDTHTWPTHSRQRVSRTKTYRLACFPPGLHHAQLYFDSSRRGALGDEHGEVLGSGT